MRKFIATLIVGALLLPTVALAGEKYMPAPLEKTITWIASSNSTLTSDALDLRGLRQESSFFGIQFAIVSAMGSVSLTKIEAHCSNDGTNYVEPVNQVDFSGALTDENWHYNDLAIPPARYLKFSSVTAAGSATDSTITMKIYGW